MTTPIELHQAMTSASQAINDMLNVQFSREHFMDPKPSIDRAREKLSSALHGLAVLEAGMKLPDLAEGK